MNYSRSSLEEECNQLNHRLEYKVRVRGTLYLWGSAGVKVNALATSALVLHVRNDKDGEIIAFGTQAGGAAGAQTTFGTLQPGECYSIPIQKISGVFASCDPGLESTVYCVITPH